MPVFSAGDSQFGYRHTNEGISVVFAASRQACILAVILFCFWWKSRGKKLRQTEQKPSVQSPDSTRDTATISMQRYNSHVHVGDPSLVTSVANKITTFKISIDPISTSDPLIIQKLQQSIANSLGVPEAMVPFIYHAFRFLCSFHCRRPAAAVAGLHKHPSVGRRLHHYSCSSAPRSAPRSSPLSLASFCADPCGGGRRPRGGQRRAGAERTRGGSGPGPQRSDQPAQKVPGVPHGRASAEAEPVGGQQGALFPRRTSARGRRRT